MRKLFDWVRRFPRLAYTLGEASNALNLLLLAVLARLLRVESYGELVAVMATAGILGELIEFGFPTLIVRAVARNPDAAWQELRHALWRQSLMCVPMLAILYVYMRYAHLSPGSHFPGLLIGASIGFRSLKATVRGVCRAVDRFSTESLFLWTERAGLLAFCLLAVAMGGGLAGVAWVFFLTRAVDFAVYLWVVRRGLLPGLAGAAPAIHAPIPLRSALPFAVSGLLWSLYYQVNAALLSLLSTARDTGLFGALYRFVDILAVLPRLIIVVAYPAMSRAWTEDRERFEKMFHELEEKLTLIGLPLLATLSLWGGPLLRLAFGEEYAAGAAALRLIFVGILFTFHSMFLTQTLQSAGHEVKLALGLLATVVFNVGLNFWLIPRHGFMGAAIATVATEVLYYIVLVAAAWGTGALRRAPISWRTAVSALLLGAVTWAGDRWANAWGAAGCVVLFALCGARLIRGMNLLGRFRAAFPVRNSAA